MTDRTEHTGATIEDFLSEDRTFAPSDEVRARSLLAGRDLYAEASRGVEAFWADQANDLLTWKQPFDSVLEWELPDARWFGGGTLNVAENCLDRHVDAGYGDQVAYHWEGEPGDTRTITYAALRDEVAQVANVLRDFGVRKGDRVAIYLPMIPELPISMLACARIGAVHSVVFGGFSADALADRINDSDCKVLVTADGGWRRGKAALLKPAADVAVANTATIEHVLVVQRTGASGDDTPIAMTEGRDHWYHDLVPEASTDCPADAKESENLLYLH
jgi:acetyl-CoA synthetase